MLSSYHRPNERQFLSPLLTVFIQTIVNNKYKLFVNNVIVIIICKKKKKNEQFCSFRKNYFEQNTQRKDTRKKNLTFK